MAHTSSGIGKGWARGVQYVKRINCLNCGKLFYAPPSQIKRGGGKYCSNKCFGTTLTKEVFTRKCKTCGNMFDQPKEQKHRRCPKCRIKCRIKCKEVLIKFCRQCGKQISSSKQFCGLACYLLFRKLNKTGTGVKSNRICKKCGSAFYASPGHLKKGQGVYCSMRCRPISKHGRGNGGTREDLGIYVRSTWEANYARFLNFLVKNGDIKKWEYEPETFVFHEIKRGIRSYTPDFKITENNGSEVFHEVKGYMDDKSKTKLNRMSKYYPQYTVILIQHKQMKEIKNKFSALLPCWESGTNDKL